MIIITGPTSSGKTSLALKIAKKVSGELISADSRQIYKHLDIGTGKRPINMSNSEYRIGDKFWEIEGVKIWMYDVVNPNEDYSSAQYANEAKEILGKINTPILVGGTGFYIDSLLTDSIDNNVPSAKENFSDKTLDELQAELPKDYLETWNNSERNNKLRLIRAINIYKSTGKWPDKNKKPKDPSENNLVFELTAPREFLYERVDKWAEAIWSPLLIELSEIKKLGYIDTPPLKGIIYKTAENFLNGQISQESAIQEIKFDLHAYIRRQQTWFKKYKNSIKVDITEKSFDSDVLSRVESYLNGR